MILELGDGRELRLPDNMDDEAARQLKRYILTVEERARDAERAVSRAHDDMAGMRQEVIAMHEKHTAFAATMDALRSDFKSGIERLIAATLADRVVVPDETGEYTRSKAVTGDTHGGR